MLPNKLLLVYFSIALNNDALFVFSLWLLLVCLQISVCVSGSIIVFHYFMFFTIIILVCVFLCC